MSNEWQADRKRTKRFFEEKQGLGYDLASSPWVTLAVGVELQNLLISRTIRPGMTALEVGCGVGIEAMFLQKHGLDVTAIDFVADTIAVAKKVAASTGASSVDFLVGDFLDIDLRPHVGRFDFIYDQGCFHHIPPRERAQYAMRVHHLLTEDGVFFLRAFSDEMRASPAGDGPIRLSADDILSTFMPWFTVESMRRIDNIPLPYGDKPQRFWSFLGRRRIVGAPEHGG